MLNEPAGTRTIGPSLGLTGLKYVLNGYFGHHDASANPHLPSFKLQPPPSSVMGFTLPPRMNSVAADNVRSLMARKDALEDELEAQLGILQSQSVTMDTPLVDAEGFPRADIDVWAVRHARVRIIELRNDHKALMDRIMVALQSVYEPSSLPQEQRPSSTAGSASGTLQPFARVDGVAPGSPAASAVRGHASTSTCSTALIVACRDCCGKISSSLLDRSTSHPSRRHHYSLSLNWLPPKRT